MPYRKHRDPNHIYIYNVSKKLVNARGRSRVVNFKYDSSDGYAHFVVDESCVSDSANPNFYNIKMPADKMLRLNYKDGNEMTAKEMMPAEIKRMFEETRYKKSSQNQTSNSNSRRSYDFDEVYDPFDEFEF